MNNSTVKPQRDIVLKSGVWYTFSTFLFRGMAFITTPIFTRLLTKGEYGDFSNIAAWLSILMVLTSWDLHTSIVRSKLEFKEDMDSYVLSILTLSTLITAVIYIIVLVFKDFFCNKVFGIDEQYINLMFLYLFAAPAFNMLTTKNRAFYKYKMFTILTGVSVVTSTILSLILVLIMDNNRLMGRVVGQYLPLIFLGFAMYIFLFAKGRGIKLKYWDYAISICLPLVPHVLSMHILSGSDRIIIKRISGAEAAAIYSVAYSCAHIVSILLDSMNKAWAPWLLDSIHCKDFKSIKKVSKTYFLLFFVLVIGILLIVPEIIYILGGKSYIEAKYVLPPLILGTLFQFVYTMYVQIEFYSKKTIGIAMATGTAAVINIVLNLIFIPIYGYVAAAYTTLVGYICLLFIHYYLVKGLKMEKIYDRRIIFIGLAIAIPLTFIILYTYSANLLRYCLLALYVMLIIWAFIKNRKTVIKIFKNKK